MEAIDIKNVCGIYSFFDSLNLIQEAVVIKQ